MDLTKKKTFFNYLAILCFAMIKRVISEASTIFQTTSDNVFLVRTKIICSCLMNDMEDNEIISCPNSLRLNIYNGYLFDSGPITDQENCTSRSKNDVILKFLNQDLQNFCAYSSNCSITKSFIINAKGDYVKADCLSAEIYWTCTQSSSQTPPTGSSHNFTYFFYIITLILSSSCILVGALFILRRFLMMRRRNNNRGARLGSQGLGNYSTNQTFVNNTSNSGVWTTNGGYGPPSYEHIYDSSMPIVNGIPPPYDIVKNKKMPDSIVLYNNPTQQQQEQTLANLVNAQQQIESNLDQMQQPNLGNSNQQNENSMNRNNSENPGYLNDGEQVLILFKNDLNAEEHNRVDLNTNSNGENAKNELVHNSPDSNQKY